MSNTELKALSGQVAELSVDVGAFLLSEQQKITANAIERKGANNLVSYADKQAELMFVNGLQKLLPEAGFIAEEGTGSPSSSGLNWVIDPLDGTTNYLHKLPFWCTSVALVKNNEPLAGVIYDPTHREIFVAFGNNPATLNGFAMNVSKVDILKNMLMVTGFPYDDRGMLQKNLMAIELFCKHSRGIRRLGSAALDMAYVACGRFDGFYEYGLNPWDVAAGALLVRNSGGRVDDFNMTGNPIFGEEIIAASAAGFNQIQEIVAKCFKAEI